MVVVVDMGRVVVDEVVVVEGSVVVVEVVVEDTVVVEEVVVVTGLVVNADSGTIAQPVLLMFHASVVDHKHIVWAVTEWFAVEVSVDVVL